MVSETAIRDKIRNEEEKVLEQISHVSRRVYKWLGSAERGTHFVADQKKALY